VRCTTQTAGQLCPYYTDEQLEKCGVDCVHSLESVQYHILYLPTAREVCHVVCRAGEVCHVVCRAGEVGHVL
jgi:hypothetical protein